MRGVGVRGTSIAARRFDLERLIDIAQSSHVDRANVNTRYAPGVSRGFLNNSGKLKTAPEGGVTPSRSLTRSLDLPRRGSMNDTRLCTESDCTRPHFGRGYCRIHYVRHSRYSPELVGNRLCKVEGCERGHEARGYCYNHDRRVQAHGHPLGGRLNNLAPASDRLKHYSTRVGDCIEWTGLKDRKGYGRIGVDGSTLAAHRVAYAEFVGPVPDGLVVRHKCDNPPCINPDHLEVGTQADNARDMVERGRSTRGARNPGARLTNEQAIEIYHRAKAEGGYRAIGLEYGVGESTVHNIVAGNSWSSVTGARRRTAAA